MTQANFKVLNKIVERLKKCVLELLDCKDEIEISQRLQSLKFVQSLTDNSKYHRNVKCSIGSIHVAYSIYYNKIICIRIDIGDTILFIDIDPVSNIKKLAYTKDKVYTNIRFLDDLSKVSTYINHIHYTNSIKDLFWQQSTIPKECPRTDCVYPIIYKTNFKTDQQIFGSDKINVTFNEILDSMSITCSTNFSDLKSIAEKANIEYEVDYVKIISKIVDAFEGIYGLKLYY